MKIAVFIPSRPHFGNILTQLPFLCALQKEYPNAEIEIWSKFEQSKVLLTVDISKTLINYKKFSFFQLVNALNERKYDVIYNLYSGSDKVHAAIGLSNVKVTFGHSNKKIHKHCYQKHIQISKGFQYIANSHLALLNSIKSTDYTPDIIRSLATKSSVKNKTELTLLPGGGAGEYKRWHLDKYLATAESIAQSNATLTSINWILGPDEAHYKHSIPSHIVNIPVRLHQSPNIFQLIDIAELSVLSIANDCGPTHIFQMLMVPLITLWGWKDEKLSPYNTMTEWFYSHENSWAVVPNENEKCINAITVDKVSSLALAQINR
ncbi:glycosyltransferase family 9 protein [Psychromonas sp. Urea-02u-13]|uniref:glycosyltransferase family 9 protein n=1 Tax=Psychromonas sp. Urea-02u-13 TaxID=2058326 RepID=UPI000C331828|nr:glycosyltransferase family 9 protein [Psychromonas sp. Urea-02u-13]PKG38101.1 6-pyruvoyl tetrahydropterin synthase [Psychromonas sp. Urea-02u-13]